MEASANDRWDEGFPDEPPHADWGEIIEHEACDVNPNHVYRFIAMTDGLRFEPKPRQELIRTISGLFRKSNGYQIIREVFPPKTATRIGSVSGTVLTVSGCEHGVRYSRLSGLSDDILAYLVKLGEKFEDNRHRSANLKYTLPRELVDLVRCYL